MSVLLILVFFLFMIFVQSFFTAGAIGMAKKASETGDTVFSDMLISGSKNVFRLFLTTLLMTLLLLVGIIFMVPGALAVGDLSLLIENPAAQIQSMGVLSIGMILWGTYIMAVSIVLSLTSYALVIDELDPLEALSAGFRFFMENKLDVFFVWIIYVGMAFINTLVSEYFRFRKHSGFSAYISATDCCSAPSGNCSLDASLCEQDGKENLQPFRSAFRSEWVLRGTLVFKSFLVLKAS